MSIEVSNKKEDFVGRLGNVANNFIEFIKVEFPYEVSFFEEEINSQVLSLLNIDKPKVMVYGIYNSGKSTLINSLCKEEVAEVADRPMTAKISEFDRGDYILVDSPGVDAPIEHEKITEDYLKKCHVILFVISSKGVFEDRTNYKKLADLVARDVPFIIILNDRGMAIDKKWTEVQKQEAKFNHEQELKVIQYKIINNLIIVSNDKNIADKYEVVVLNARKALIGIQKEKPQLYEASNVTFLENRISQLLSNNESIIAVLKQPIANLKECLSIVEKLITQNMNDNLSEDFEMRLHTLESKKENIMQDMKIMVRQAVDSRLDDLTNHYMNGDTEVLESIANDIFMDIDDRYAAKLNELFVYIKNNFKNVNLYLDAYTNLFYDQQVDIRNFDVSKMTENDFRTEQISIKKWGFLDLFKSRKRKEKEKREQLEAEARLRNEQEQYKVQEKIRKKQEARQAATMDLQELYKQMIIIVSNGLNEKYDGVISEIQQYDCINKQLLENGNRQMNCLRSIRNELIEIENELG